MKKEIITVCFTAIAALFFIPALNLLGQEGWGNMKGRVKVVGELPELKREVIDKDQATCLADQESPLDDNIIVGQDGEFKDVFVMMYLRRSKKKPPVHPSYESQMSEPIVLDNKNCRFQPHAFFVRKGQTLRMKNSDDVGHNCHSKAFNNEFNVTVPRGDFVDLKLNDVENVPGDVVCDIHPWMDALMLVREEPYAAITDKNGEFEIQKLPAGTWKFHLWHKKMAYLRKLEVPDSKVGKYGEFEVEIKDGETLDLGELKIDAKYFRK